MKLIYTYFILFLCFSCSNSRQLNENFDVITVDEYENLYNTQGKLAAVKITSTEQMYKLNIPTTATVNTQLLKYTYRNNSLYSIRKLDEQIKNKITTTYYKNNSEETIAIGESNDTTDYSLYCYMDYKKKRPRYIRIIRHFLTEADSDFTIDNNYEEWHYYDAEGNKTKIVKHNFNTNQTTETHFFDIPYEEAFPLLQKSDNTQIVICQIDSSTNDTLIKKIYRDGKVNQITKKYISENKNIEYTQMSDGTEAFITQYKEGELDIITSNVLFMWNEIDSIYSKEGKIMRETHISHDLKHQIVYEYDQYGNLRKKTRKTKLLKHSN